MKEIDLHTPMGAIFSDDRRFRYVLWRVWNQSRPLLLSIGLNPSKAGEFNNDPTIARDMVRADREGFGGLLKGNLYAFVSTNPNELLGQGSFEYYVGEQNDQYLQTMIKIAACTLCGWGSFKPVIIRAPTVLKMIPEPYCLGTNSDRQPKHPLYISYATPMVKYEVSK